MTQSRDYHLQVISFGLFLDIFFLLSTLNWLVMVPEVIVKADESWVGGRRGGGGASKKEVSHRVKSPGRRIFCSDSAEVTSSSWGSIETGEDACLLCIIKSEARTREQCHNFRKYFPIILHFCDSNVDQWKASVLGTSINNIDHSIDLMQICGF